MGIYRCDNTNEAGVQCALVASHIGKTRCRFGTGPRVTREHTEQPKSRMNKTETRYANILQGYVLAGEILRYEFEAFTFRLGDRTRYTPDFMVVRPDHSVEFHEVKGSYIWEDARVKVKAAASRFNCFKFILAQWKKGQWNITEIKT